MAYDYYTSITAIHPRDAFCTQLKRVRKMIPLLPGMTGHDRNVVCIFNAFKAMGIASATQGERYIAYLESTKHQHHPKPFAY